MKNFEIAVRELIRDYHVTSGNIDKGFGRAVVRSFVACVLGL